MQPIDPNSLFSIFEQGDEQVYKEHGMEQALSNPFVLMGMVLKGLENYYMMDLMYTKQYPKEYGNVKEITKYKYYTRLYGYLIRIDTDNFDDIYQIGTSFNVKDTTSGLSLLLYYFEGLEEYEKCAVVKKYIDLLRESTPKKVGNLI
jgi:hypothetical protein